MTRGTTPTNTFTVNADVSTATVYITYSQGGQTVVEKTGDDLTITTEIVDETATSTIVTTLTQEETLAMNTSVKVRIQLRAVYEDGTAIASGIIERSVGEILKDEEIEYV